MSLCLWPHMQRLAITDDIINIARFLKNITLPPNSKLHLKTFQRMHEAAPHIPLVID